MKYKFLPIAVLLTQMHLQAIPKEASPSLKQEKKALAKESEQKIATHVNSGKRYKQCKKAVAPLKKQYREAEIVENTDPSLRTTNPTPSNSADDSSLDAMQNSNADSSNQNEGTRPRNSSVGSEEPSYPEDDTETGLPPNPQNTNTTPSMGNPQDSNTPPAKRPPSENPPPTDDETSIEEAVIVTDTTDAPTSDSPSSPARSYRNPAPTSVKLLDRSKGGPYITGEYLRWKTRQGGAEYAITYNPILGNLADGHMHAVEFGYDNGWRAGIGYNLPHDLWDLYAAYTHYNTSASSSTGGQIFPYLSYQGANPVPLVTQASSSWSIHFHSWDALFGKTFVPSHFFTIKPFVGIKEAKIEQTSLVLYSGGLSIPTGQSFTVGYDNEFQGVGLQLGFQSKWLFGWGFGFFGNFSSSLLYGHTNTHQTQTQLSVEQVSLKHHTEQLTPAVQALAGLSWDWVSRKERFHIGLQAGFETQYFWNEYQLDRFSDSVYPISISQNQGIGFFGFSLGGRLDF